MLFGKKKTKLQTLHQRPRPLVSSRLNLLVFCTPKCGFTFGAKWFFWQQGLLEEALARNEWIHDYRQHVYCTGKEYDKQLLDFLDRPKEFRVVKLARNPFSRAVSSYVHANRNFYEDELIAAFLGRPLDKEEKRFSFREFVSYLESIDVRTCNPHHRVQQHASELAGIAKTTHVLRLEETVTALNELEQELGLPISEHDKFRKSAHHTKREPQEGGDCCADVVFSGLVRGATVVPPTEAFYDEELLQRVAKVYAGDFELYGYPIDQL